ncbi:MAG: fatty acid desaturase family protein [Actinomycetota bacterium]
MSATSVLERVEVPKRREFLTPWHGAVNVAHILTTHALLLAWFWLGFRYLPLALYIVGSLPVCLVHQRAMSEWIHEGAHFNVVPSHRWNDRFTNLLAGMWFALPVRVYRAIHLQHHRKHDFFVADDPDTVFLEVRSRRTFWLGVVRDLTGLTILRQLGRFNESDLVSSRDRRTTGLSAAAIVAVFALAFWIGRIDAALLYYGTLATLYPLLNRLRTYGQHVAVEQSGQSRFDGSGVSRTIDAGLLDRIVHTSPRLMYHHEHHQYPHLPYRALRQVLEPSDDVNQYTRSRWRVLRAVYAGLPAR